MADTTERIEIALPSAEEEAKAKVAFSPLIVVDMSRQIVKVSDKNFFLKTVSGGDQNEIERLETNLAAGYLPVVEPFRDTFQSRVVNDADGGIREQWADQIQNANTDLQWRGLSPSDAIALARNMLGGETLAEAVAGGSLVRVEEISDVQAQDAPDVIFVTTSGSNYLTRPNEGNLIVLQRSQRGIRGKENCWRFLAFKMEEDQLAVVPGFENLVASVGVGVCPAIMKPIHQRAVTDLDSPIEGRLASYQETPKGRKYCVLHFKSPDWSPTTLPQVVTAGQVTGIYVPGETRQPETPAR